MRIATLSNAAVIHTRRWVEHFRARGHSVAVWSLERGPEGLEARALPRASLPNFLRYPLAAGPLRRALAEFRPDLIDAHYVPNYGVIASLSGFRPISVAAWGSDLLVAARRDPLQRLRARFVLRRADLVIADGGDLARAAVELGAPAERVHAIPWGVDLARFARPEAREPAGVGRSPEGTRKDERETLGREPGSQALGLTPSRCARVRVRCHSRDRCPVLGGAGAQTWWRALAAL